MSLQNNNHESGFVEGDLNQHGQLQHIIDSSVTLKESTTGAVVTGDNANISVHLHENASKAEKVNINSLVLFINRHNQLAQLNERLNEHKEFSTPLFCIVYGCKYEVPDNFILRLAKEHCVEVLLLPEKRTQSKPLPENANTLIFWQSYEGADCRKYGVQRILDEFLNEWRTYEFKPRNKPILFCVQFQHTSERWLFNRWKKEMCRYLSQLSEHELNQKYGVHALILSELQPVAFRDVHHWLLEFFLNKGFLEGSFINDVKDQIYKGKDTVSMNILIKALRNLLKDKLSSQG